MDEISELGLFSPADTEIVVRIHPSFYFGMTVAELRRRGANIPENIPDCATFVSPGVFKWIDIKWEVRFEQDRS